MFGMLVIRLTWPISGKCGIAYKDEGLLLVTPGRPRFFPRGEFWTINEREQRSVSRESPVLEFLAPKYAPLHRRVMKCSKFTLWPAARRRARMRSS